MIDYLEIKTDADCLFVVNLLNYAGIPLRKVRPCEGGCRMWIPSEDGKKALALLADNGKVTVVCKDKTVKKYLRRNFLRFGLWAGLVFAVILLVFYSAQVTRIEINGLQNLAETDILQAVNALYEFPVAKKDLERKEIVKAVTTLDGVASCAAEIKGNTLIVTVYEELEKVPVPDKTDFTDIVSSYDAVVTRIIVYSGTGLVKKGDTVRKGQTLISSDVKLDETLIAKEKPFGEIYGRVWITKTVVISETVLVRKRTGRTETRVSFQKEIEYKGEFADYDEEVSEFFLPSVVPLKMYVHTYYETATVEEERDFSENEEAIVSEYFAEMESSFPAGSVALDKWYDVKRLDKNLTLELYYEIETKLNS